VKKALSVVACTVIAIPVLVCIAFFVLGRMSQSGEAPGIVEGRLARCPDKPNCVCSEFKEDSKHHIEAIPIPEGFARDVMPVLRESIEEMGGTIQTERDHYLSFAVTSAFFGFVDDVEIRIDPAQEVVHVRSASRVGYSDRGVNKKRVELLRSLLNEKFGGTD
jgi:uncharacterized protein (DUF1499 family)